jgi:hypothetical protein
LYAQRFAKPAVILDYQSKELAQGKLYANMSHLAFSSGQQEHSENFCQQVLKLNNPKALSVNSFLLVRKDKTTEALAVLDALVRTKKPIY